MESTKRLLEEQLCFSIYTASKQFNKMYAAALKPFNLTYSQYIVLLVLWETDDLTISEIGEKVGLDTGTLTPLLKRMEQHGYVTRVRLPEDERKVKIKLTEKAVQLETPIFEQVGACLEQLAFEKEAYDHLLQEINQLGQKIGGIIHEENL